MASLSNESWISEDDLLRTDHIMIAVPSVVFITRVVVQFYRRGRRFEWQDGWLYLAFAAFIAFSTCYVLITPIFFKLEKLVQDPTNPDNLWPSMTQDTRFIAQVMWCSGMMFWTCLWGVKFSFLALYKKLLVGLSRTWFWAYWGIVAFSVVAYISCIITGPVIACNDTRAFLTQGKLCSNDDESRRQTVNLYYAYAIDVVTNLMVMFLPLRLVMPLQMAPIRKFGVAMLFTSGFVIIIFSTIRVVQVTAKTSKHKSPDAKWITMWTIIECSTAVVVGCCPVLASLIPRLDRVDYDTNGYVRQGRRASNEAGSNNEVRLESLNSAQSKKTKNNSSELSWTDPTDEYVRRQEAERAAKAARDAVPPVPEDDVRRTDPRNLRNLRRMR